MKDKPLFLDFFKFIIRPTYLDKKQNKHFLLKIWNTLRLWALGLILALFFGFITEKLMRLVNYDVTDHAIVNLLQQQSVLLVLFLAVILAPIIEELTFRMIYRYSPFRLSFSIVFVFLTIFELIISSLKLNIFEKFNALLGLNDYLQILGPYLILFKAGIFLIMIVGFGLALGFIIKFYIDQNKIISFFKKYFFVLFYAFIIFFGLMHLVNFSNILKYWYLAPVFIIPQLVIALFLGYARIKYGLIYSIMLHAVYNGVTLLPFFLFSNILEQEFIEKLLMGGDLEEFQISQVINYDKLAIGLVIIGVMLLFVLIFIMAVLHYILELFFYSKR
ncbi:MAG: CPBP family intramembrane metalloprotease [Candidatus Moranbacteria bacterium]|nr:CPBP family intramembrane metalloprotease [Candidatus Moranbacteria bacterium]